MKEQEDSLGEMMKREEVLQKVIEQTKEGSYYTTKGITTIKTLEGVTILTCSDNTITFYTPFFNLNICEHVSQEKYGEYDVKELTENTLERILNIFHKRLLRSVNKYKNYLKGI